MARALVLGETDIPTEDTTTFCASGAIHLFAISGLHSTLITLKGGLVLRKLLSCLGRIVAVYNTYHAEVIAWITLAWLYPAFQEHMDPP
ncbi:hypothetical protein BCY86_00440 [Pajaroellobacter abortibovis]|uniref:ComEC/Rec2-related protein domain-containing protein n=1 Tax=Pajaroellobacter abortibovis TaxID=1882918 RepID=A0A1L6MV10_9BACT|nr:ComEC/Rec2 family competence protein [Pajaroellobacter abortibovis]APR99311.1 hypothetical protein BCY86_00440 [Pajaroellobacter abortibovis]